MFKFLAFLHIMYCVPMKGSYTKPNGGNFITSWPNACLASDFTDCSVSLRRIFLTRS